MKTSCRVGGLGKEDWDWQREPNQLDPYQADKREIERVTASEIAKKSVHQKTFCPKLGL